MSKFFKIKSEQIKPTTPKPTTQPANGYQWSWNVSTAQWEQVPINSQYSYNITDDKNRVNTSNTNYTTQTTGYTTASFKNVISCLSQFINVDDFNDGILFLNGLKYKPSNKMYEYGLVKYAGYDFVNGCMCKITSKGLNLIKKYELNNYNRLKKQIESSIGDATDVPSTIPGFDFPCEGIRPEDGTYDTDNKKFADFEKQSIKWYNIDLSKNEAEKLKSYLKENNIKYEVSEVENDKKNLIHFEIQLKPQTLQTVSTYIDNNINKISKKAAENDLDLDHVWSIIYKFSDDDIREYMVTDFDGKYYTLLNLKDNNSGNITIDSYWRVSERFIRENVKNGKMLLTYDY